VEFAGWCDQKDLRELADIEPRHEVAHVETLQTRLAAPSVNSAPGRDPHVVPAAHYLHAALAWRIGSSSARLLL
jgi:hypothetical protein